MQSQVNIAASGERTGPARPPAATEYHDTAGNEKKPGIPGCIRRMSRSERVLFMSPACTAMVAARITGAVEEKPFRQALDAACRRHPLLRTKIVFDARHDAWFSSEGVPPVPLEIIPRKTDRQWMDELTERVRVPFDISTGPLIRCVLITSPEASDLLVFCNHSICDGMALAILVKDLLSLYANPGPEVRMPDPPDIMAIRKPRLSFRRLIAWFFTGLANRKWRKNPYYFTQEDYSALYSSYWEERKPGFVLLEFDPAESARLLAACREHGVTVGSAVTTAYLAAHAGITGRFLAPQKTLLVPYDMRKRTDPPVGDVFCFCVRAFRFPFTYSPERSFWENAGVLNHSIHSRLEKPDPADGEIPDFEPSLIDAIFAFGLFTDLVPEAYSRTELLKRFIRDTGNSVFLFCRDIRKNEPDLVPSNMGRIDSTGPAGGLCLDRLVFLTSGSEITHLLLSGAGVGGSIVFCLPFVTLPEKTAPSPEPEMIRMRNRVLELLGFPEKVHPDVME